MLWTVATYLLKPNVEHRIEDDTDSAYAVYIYSQFLKTFKATEYWDALE